jgi:ABC-type nickel/cobalt efflux system permease component RcnA
MSSRHLHKLGALLGVLMMIGAAVQLVILARYMGGASELSSRQLGAYAFGLCIPAMVLLAGGAVLVRLCLRRLRNER